LFAQAAVQEQRDGELVSYSDARQDTRQKHIDRGGVVPVARGGALAFEFYAWEYGTGLGRGDSISRREVTEE
jgi:hypothetical protein